MGTWGIGGFSNPNLSRDAQAVEAVRRGLELGLALIDTAEMYGRGHTEEVVAEAIAGIREQVFLATKVSAGNLSYHSVLKACDASLKRLGTSYIDLYQIHWPNKRYPIRKTMRAMEENAEAVGWRMTKEDYVKLGKSFQSASD